jgi:hypothetical protein
MTTNGNISLTVIFPKPFGGSPSPSNFIVYGFLGAKVMQGLLGGGVAWISGAHNDPCGLAKAGDCPVSFFFRKNASHGYNEVIVVGFVLGCERRVGPWPSVQSITNALSKPLRVDVAGIGHHAEIGLNRK